MLQVYSSLHGPQLIGIVSNGAESCMGGLPGIFTRVMTMMMMMMMMTTINSRLPFMKDDGAMMSVTIMVIVLMIDTFIASIRKQLGKLSPKNWHLACWLLQLFKFILESVGSE